MTLFKSIQNCYCAFCRMERKIIRKKHVGMRDIFYALVFSVSLSLMIWQQVSLNIFIFMALYLVLCEVVVQMMWRAYLPCSHCGFDPVLYLKNRKEAVQRVQSHLQKIKEDPSSLLRPQINWSFSIDREHEKLR